jgi:hypothetical protein
MAAAEKAVEEMARATVPLLFQIFPSIQIDIEKCLWVISNRALPSVVKAYFNNCTLFVHVKSDEAGEYGVGDGNAHRGGFDVASGDQYLDGTSFPSRRNSVSQFFDGSSPIDEASVSEGAAAASGGGVGAAAAAAAAAVATSGAADASMNGGTTASGSAVHPDPFVYYVTGDIAGFSVRAFLFLGLLHLCSRRTIDCCCLA